MAQVRSKKLISNNFNTFAFVTMYTVPAGETAVIRTITVTNKTANAMSYSLNLGFSSSTINAIQWHVAIPANTTHTYDHWYSIGPGGLLQARLEGTQTGTLAIQAFGAELEGSAD